MYTHNSIDAPPPPYTPLVLSGRTSTKPSLANLPLHVVHRILILTLDQKATPSKFWSDPEEERVRRLWGMFRGLRGVNRVFWLGKFEVGLGRAHYLPFYLALVKPLYSSDPFPFESSSLSSPSLSIDPSDLGNIYAMRGRETAVLDKFVATRVGEELRRVESELSEGSEAERDIFGRLQPCARSEDLLSTLPQTLITPITLLPSPPPPARALPLPQSLLSINLTPAWAQLYINAFPVSLTKIKGGREMVLEVRRLDRERRMRSLEETVRLIGEALEDMRRGLVEWGGRVE
uniref:Uncharacterized protein n=1 Tax=Cryptococcus bacillisporus CA1280 TaxID=1296109 RepID=A0A0D0VJP9_CRYGA|nr:hypothetical protein I312_03379 [Cryptococcus bacillisporus CA1280]